MLSRRAASWVTRSLSRTRICRVVAKNATFATRPVRAGDTASIRRMPLTRVSLNEVMPNS